MKPNTTEARHTAEPWSCKPNTLLSTEIFDNTGLHIAIVRHQSGDEAHETYTDGEIMPRAEARGSNALRIVACVNACAGMADPAAEIAALREQVKELSAAKRTFSDLLSDAAFQLAQLTGENLAAYARTFAALARAALDKK